MSCHYLALCWPTSLMSNAFASGLVRYTRGDTVSETVPFDVPQVARAGSSD